jgi:hypothetical protein
MYVCMHRERGRERVREGGRDGVGDLYWMTGLLSGASYV